MCNGVIEPCSNIGDYDKGKQLKLKIYTYYFNMDGNIVKKMFLIKCEKIRDSMMQYNTQITHK